MDKTFGAKEENLQYWDRPGAYLLPVKDGCLAVARTPEGYYLLGGGIDPGETHEECILRECMEETGCTARVEGYIGSAEVYCRHSELGYFHPIQYYYSGQLGERIAEPIETDHTLEWIPINEAEWKLNVKPQIWAVKRLLGCPDADFFA